MSPSNRTAERLRSLDKALAAGRVTREEYARKKAQLEALGPSFEARWTLADGKTERTKTFRGRGAEKRAADYEAEQKGMVRRREAQDPQHLKATVAYVLDYYLEEKMHRDGKPRASYKNARAHRNNIVDVWGDRLSLDALDRDPEPYMKRLKRELTKSFPGGHWNNKVTLKAALAYFIRRKRLRILNPVDVIDWPAPDNKRKQHITFDGHRRALAAAQSLRPFWLPAFLESGWETGWRSGEVQDWAIERARLNPKGEDYPWIETLIEKQGEVVYEEKPITFRLAAILKGVIGNRKAGPIFPGSRSAIDRWVRRAFDLAGLEDYRFHDYRRSIKKRLAGLPDALVAEYTGHDEDMHDRYSRAARTRQDYLPILRHLEPKALRDMAGDTAAAND